MPQNPYNLHDQELFDALAESGRETERVVARARYLDPWRSELRRLIAYLTIRWDPAWLGASPEVLEGYLVPNWHVMAHHELVTYLDVQGITPEHCTLT